MKFYSVEDCNKLTNVEVRKLYRDHVSPYIEEIFGSFSAGSVEIDYAEGVYIYTRDGRRILDAGGGIGVLNLGHNYPDILQARIKYQQEKRMEVHKTMFSPYLAVLSHNIAQILPDDLNYPYFCNSGAEAVEGAIKLAYKAFNGERAKLLHSNVSFHGKLLGSGSISHSKEVYFKFPGILDTDSFEYGSIESIKGLVGKYRKENNESDVYSIIIEPYSASSSKGCSNEFLHELRELCDKEKIVLIFDEIYTGWCKTGNYFYFMDYGIVPDVLTTSKSLGGGKSSISAYVARERTLLKAYGNLRDATLHSTTYNGFGEECVTAITAINAIVKEDLVSKSRHIEELVKSRMRELLEKFPNQLEEYRGIGCMHSIYLKNKGEMVGKLLSRLPISLTKDERFLPKLLVASLSDWLFRKHNIYILFGTSQDTPLAFTPSPIMKDGEVNYFFDSLESSLEVGIWEISFKFAIRKFAKFFI